MLFKKMLWLFSVYMISTLSASAQLSAGTYTVGTLGGENYSSLTNNGGLFQDINSIGLSGNIIVEITSDLTETATHSLQQWGGGFSVYIRPQTASLKTITQSGCATDMVLLDGADNLTLDGRFGGTGTDRFLRFISACNSESPIALEDDCQNVTIRNCIISSDNNQTSQAFGGALHIDDNQTNGSDNLKILHNLIEDYSGAIDLFDAIQVNAPDQAGAQLTGLEIRWNEIRNANGKSIYLIDRAGSIEDAVIHRNTIYADGTVSGPGPGWAFAGIQIESGGGHDIRANYIGGRDKWCTGGKFDVTLGAGTQSISLIRLKDDLANVNTITVDSNVVKNLTLNGSASNQTIVSIIRLEEGNADVGLTYPNFIGDTTVDASTLAGSSISFQENYNSTSNAFRAVYTTSSGTVNVHNNIIGGIFLADNNSNGINTAILYSNGTSASIRDNRVGGVSNNIYKECPNDFRMIYSNNDDLTYQISGNHFRGISSGGSFDDDVYGIYTRGGNGAPKMINNIFYDFNIVTDDQLYMIRNENDDAVFYGNRISNINLFSTKSNHQFYGIHNDVNSSTILVENNVIKDVELTNTAVMTVMAACIYLDGSSDYTVESNWVSEVAVLSNGTSSYIRAFYLNPASSYSVINNVVLLDNNGYLRQMYIYGIWDASTSGSTNVWHNTVDIRGTGTGSRRTACYYKTGGATRNVQNNIFNNLRTGGSSGNYAMYFNTTGGLTADYNLLYASEDQNRLVRYGGNQDFADWQGLGFAANSVEPQYTQLLVDFSLGYQTTTAGNDIGNSSLGVALDHDDTGRPIGAGVDMGAFEIDDSFLTSPLPVELSYFESICDDDETLLLWGTKSESDNDYFTLFISSDGLNWTEVRQFQGAGTTVNVQDYEYTDNNHAGIRYYKLTQTDFDGSTEDLGIVSSKCDAECGEITPLWDGSALSLLMNGDCFDPFVNWTLYDSAGRLIYQSTELQNNTLPQNLSRSIYLIRVQTANNDYQLKWLPNF